MKLNVNNDYANLHRVLLCQPDNFMVIDPYHEPADKELAETQYEAFVKTLKDKGIGVEYLPLMGSPAQVFTRDLGFIVGDTLFISRMSEPLRLQETEPLRKLVTERGWNVYSMHNHLEGGDVILHDNKLFIGQSDRTSKYAIQEVQSVLSKAGQDIEVISVLINVAKIHLDCVFNVLDKDTCLLLRVSPGDTEVLAANIVNLGNHILCSNATVTQILEDHDYNSTYIEFSEYKGQRQHWLLHTAPGAGLVAIPKQPRHILECAGADILVCFPEQGAKAQGVGAIEHSR